MVLEKQRKVFADALIDAAKLAISGVARMFG
jgi:hypothetical protein